MESWGIDGDEWLLGFWGVESQQILLWVNMLLRVFRLGRILGELWVMGQIVRLWVKKVFKWVV